MKPEHKDIMKRRKRNICLTVAYDGTNYHGFQRQSPPVVAVQNVLEKRLAVIFGDTIELSAAGRTDTGVHAMGQVVNFFTDGTIPVERIPKAANNILPDDIAIVEAHEVDMDFSALHSAKRKTYEYRILQEPVRNPFKRKSAECQGYAHGNDEAHRHARFLVISCVGRRADESRAHDGHCRH